MHQKRNRGIKKWVISLALILLLVDIYLYTAMQASLPETEHVLAGIVFWFLSLFFVLLVLLLFRKAADDQKRNSFRTGLLLSAGLGILFGKAFLLLAVLTDDAIRIGNWLVQSIQNFNTDKRIALAGRNKNIIQSGMALAALPLSALTYGITIGAHDYKVSRIKLPLANLPKELEGFKIGQISDIHAGSLRSRKGVSKGIYRLLKEEADLIFFTGDLVNTSAHEVEELADLFAGVKAPYGVYSILGNHDYGLYRKWNNEEEKRKNFEELKAWHAHFGWKLLMNEHEVLHFGDSSMAVIGIENWGKSSRMPKWGKLDKAMEGMPAADINILLSHDPSFWEAKVLGNPKLKIDLTLSGHTHGMQFGVHTRYFKWSPVRYVSKHWSGLYQEGDRYLYVNRGFGHHGFPGRIGMPPEITIIELTAEV
jgi:hypothetical protein